MPGARCPVRTGPSISLYGIAGYLALRVKVKVAQSCPTLCDPMHYTVHGILQARILEWVAFLFTRGSSQPRDQTQVSCIAGNSLPAEPQGKFHNVCACVYICVCVYVVCVCVLGTQLCPTLCDPIDGSLPGSSVHGVLQARTLEWVAISFSKKRDEKDSYHLNYI